MATVRDVFNATMSLIDEVSESGLSETGETRDYQVRTAGIVSMLALELSAYLFDDPLPSGFTGVTAFEDEVPFESFLSLGIMPYGLAARLLIDENPTAASYYEENITILWQNTQSRRPRGSLLRIYTAVSPLTVGR